MAKSGFRISLRYKLLLLLTTLPVCSLALYLFVATDLFQKDKVAYVFDSSATVSRSIATQVRIEVQSAYDSLRYVVENFDFNQKKFNAIGQDIFNRNPKAHALILLRRDNSGRYVQLGSLTKNTERARAFVADPALIEKLRASAVAHAASVSESREFPGAVELAFRLGEKTSPDHMVLVAIYQADDMINAFEAGAMYTNVLVSQSGETSLGSAKDFLEMNLLNTVMKSKASDGTAEVRGKTGKAYLISYSAIGVGDLVAISKVDKQKALKAVEVLVTKSVLFFVALIAFTLLISVVASSKLTSALRELYEATKRVAQGDFTVRVKSTSSDEVGGLADSFNLMAKEVSRLLVDTAEKVRMQGELDTVKMVQETLFPIAQTQFGPLRIKGHFEPASECGGDWWSYSRVGDKIYLWIGDVTGHGAPAALITGAAKSAAAVIEILGDMNPGQALTIMNRAIHETSKGKIMMTFFLASIDLAKGTMSYACASHDPPYLLKNAGRKFARRDLIPLNDVNGSRLGEYKDSRYKDVTIEFSPGDLVFLYTDGILDIESPTGEKWGERAFLSSLIESANGDGRVDNKVDFILNRVNQYRSGAPLIDDVTMIMCEYENRMSA
jgi:sigma-B regulation protein RsbU (phosphoserine phosphatase)